MNPAFWLFWAGIIFFFLKFTVYFLILRFFAALRVCIFPVFLIS